jgi:hypothetical protein
MRERNEPFAIYAPARSLAKTRSHTCDTLHALGPVWFRLAQVAQKF